METIQDRYFRINGKIHQESINSGGDPNQIKLVVVTKKQPIEKIIQVINAGATILGENFPEEAYEKVKDSNEALNVHWHMIGHIQSRKIKYLVRIFDYVHTIDRIEIAQKLNRACIEADRRMQVLIEVNLSGEEDKYGFKVDTTEGKKQLFDQIEQMLGFKSLDFCGLMTMPPFTHTADNSREYFRKCRLLREEIQIKFNLSHFAQLSMGTSQDYKVAIQEGATLLRIGEAIMGERIYL